MKVLKEEKKANRVLKVSCFAKESKEDELIGSAELDLSETLAKLEFDGTWCECFRLSAHLNILVSKIGSSLRRMEHIEGRSTSR